MPVTVGPLESKLNRIQVSDFEHIIEHVEYRIYRYFAVRQCTSNTSNIIYAIIYCLW